MITTCKNKIPLKFGSNSECPGQPILTANYVFNSISTDISAWIDSSTLVFDPTDLVAGLYEVIITSENCSSSIFITIEDDCVEDCNTCTTIVHNVELQTTGGDCPECPPDTVEIGGVCYEGPMNGECKEGFELTVIDGIEVCIPTTPECEEGFFLNEDCECQLECPDCPDGYIPGPDPKECDCIEKTDCPEIDIIIKDIDVDQTLDCFGTPGGTAYVDTCNICVEGLTGLMPCTPTVDDCINCQFQYSMDAGVTWTDADQSSQDFAYFLTLPTNKWCDASDIYVRVTNCDVVQNYQYTIYRNDQYGVLFGNETTSDVIVDGVTTNLNTVTMPLYLEVKNLDSSCYTIIPIQKECPDCGDLPSPCFSGISGNQQPGSLAKMLYDQKQSGSATPVNYSWFLLPGGVDISSYNYGTCTTTIPVVPQGLDVFTEAEVKVAIQDGFNAWKVLLESIHPNLTINFTESSTQAGANQLIGLVDPGCISGNGGRTAEGLTLLSYFPQNYAVDSNPNGSRWSFNTVFAHEFGHLLNLGHPTTPGIMGASGNDFIQPLSSFNFATDTYVVDCLCHQMNPA